MRYFKWLGRAIQGDFGQSRTYATPAAQIVFVERLPRTLILSGVALTLALLVAIPVGIFSAVRQYSWADYVITFFSFVGFSMPIFFLGILLLFLFAVWIPERVSWFPQFPVQSVSDFQRVQVLRGEITFLQFVGDWAFKLVLPVLALSTIQMAAWTRYMRASLLEVLNQDYVRTARAKGLSERIVLYKHALRNALIPIITLVGLAIPGVFGGAVITETIFSYPGMGRAIFDSLVEKDYNVAMAALAFLALLTALFNLLADLMYAVVDPRIRYS